MKKICVFIVLLTILYACGDSEKTQEVKIENRYSMVLPAFLKATEELNDDASLQYANTSKEVYMMVIDEDKEELNMALLESGNMDSTSMNLEGFSKVILNAYKENVKILKESELEDLQINGLKAKKIIIESANDNTDVFVEYAFIEGKKDYYQVFVWTLLSQKDKYRKQIEDAIASFREL